MKEQLRPTPLPFVVGCTETKELLRRREVRSTISPHAHAASWVSI